MLLKKKIKIQLLEIADHLVVAILTSLLWLCHVFSVKGVLTVKSNRNW